MSILGRVRRRGRGLQGPIVTGALGGSGTRAIAQAFGELGVYMGGKLNPAHDNLWFTLLVKRPRWLPRRLAGKRPSPEIVEALRVLEAIMTGGNLDRERIGMLADAAADMAAWGHDDRKARKGAGAFRLPASALNAKPPKSGWWGWKEPHSHIVLPELVSTFPDLRYVHVLRHPLDMAFSDNKTDLRLWAPSFGVTPPGDGGIGDSNAQLRWWVRSAEMASANAAALGDRFTFVRFEELCSDPATTLRGVCDAFGLDASDEELGRAAAHVETPKSTGRWRQHPWQELDPELIVAAGRFGFDVPATRTRVEEGAAS